MTHAVPAGRRPPAFALSPTAVLLAVLLLAGCAVAPHAPSTMPVEVPLAWSQPATAAAEPLAAWWTRFDDPELAALVGEALASGTDVQTALATLRQARALRDVQAAALWPRLAAGASAQRSKQPGVPASNLFHAGLDASWEPDVFGGVRTAVSAADADIAASAASLGDVRISVAAETALAYLQLRGLQARLAIAADNLSSQEETLQITDWRTQAGLASSLDFEQARAATAQTRAQLPTLRTAIAQTQHSLALLTGQAPLALAARLDRVAPIPAAPATLALALPAETLRQRPDVRAAEARVAAAAARVSQADAARWPGFSLGGSIGLNALTLGGLGAGHALAGSLLASVSWPVLDGGAARAQTAAQQAALDAAGEAWRASVLGALKDVEDALVALGNDRERLATLRVAAEAAENAALLARQRYESGVVDFQTVLDTQRTQLSAQDAVASTAADLGLDHVRLYKALGGGWIPDDPHVAALLPPEGALRALGRPGGPPATSLNTP